MNCQNCGAPSSGKAFCENCGTKIDYTGSAGADRQDNWQGQHYEAYPAAQNQWPPQNNMYGGNAETAPMVKTSTYLLWMLLQLIPIVGLVMSIIFALDSSNPNRRNYFRANLIWTVIAFVIILILAAIIIPFLFSAVYDSGTEYYDYFYDSYDYLCLL